MLSCLRKYIGLLIFLSTTLPIAAQNPNQVSEFDRELEAGRQAVKQGQYAGAIEHFTRANQLQQNNCSECLVWLARLDMAGGKLDQALRHVEQAVAVAGTDQQRAGAQLYRGVILSHLGNLPAAETAFRTATAADSNCVECSFNLGFVLLKESKDQEGAQVLRGVASRFAGTPRGREIQRFIEDPSRVRKDFAPEFSARANDGQEINLDTLKGKVVLLDFWGTWCAPCRVSLPLLKDLASKVDPSKVAIIIIDEYDAKPKWEQFIQTNGVKWGQVYDGDLTLHNAFGVDGFPRYYILSRDGIILAEFKGWQQDSEATMSDAITRALEQ